MPKLSEKLIREISAKRDEPLWLLNWRLDAFAAWTKMKEPHWSEIDYKPINYDTLNYYNKPRPVDNSDLKSIYEKMGLPEKEQNALLGMATNTVIDSAAVHTSYTNELNKLGIIFLPFSDAVRQYPDLVKKYLGTVIPNIDNFYAALNAAVFSDGTFVYVPPNTKCPINLAGFFRIETAKIAQFERTLIIADAGAYLSYMEGCNAPRRPNHQLHSGVVEVIALKNSHIDFAAVQNWYAGDLSTYGDSVPDRKIQRNGIFNFITKRGRIEENATLNWNLLEIGAAKSWAYPSTILSGNNAHSDFYSLTITRGIQQTDTGTKMIHIGDNTVSNIVSYGVALDKSKQTFRSLVSFTGHGAKNVSKCNTRVIGNSATVNAFPTIVHGNSDNLQTHEATAGAIDAEQLEFLMRAGIEKDVATALIIGAMATPILSRLPMEFLVESKQLIQMALAK